MLWWWIWYLLTPSLWYWLQVRQAVARKATHHQICKIKRTSQVRRTRKMSTLHSRTWNLRRLSPLPPQAAIMGVTKRGRTKTDTGTPSNVRCVMTGFDLSSFFICGFRVEGLTLYKADQGVFTLTQYKTFHWLRFLIPKMQSHVCKRWSGIRLLYTTTYIILSLWEELHCPRFSRISCFWWCLGTEKIECQVFYVDSVEHWIWILRQTCQSSLN